MNTALLMCTSRLFIQLDGISMFGTQKSTCEHILEAACSLALEHETGG